MVEREVLIRVVYRGEAGDESEGVGAKIVSELLCVHLSV